MLLFRWRSYEIVVVSKVWKENVACQSVFRGREGISSIQPSLRRRQEGFFHPSSLENRGGSGPRFVPYLLERSLACFSRGALAWLSVYIADFEGDAIACESEEELQVALLACQDTLVTKECAGSRLFRLFVKTDINPRDKAAIKERGTGYKPAASCARPSSEAYNHFHGKHVHQRVVCDGCDGSIAGTRFKVRWLLEESFLWYDGKDVHCTVCPVFVATTLGICSSGLNWKWRYTIFLVFTWMYQPEDNVRSKISDA